MQKLDVVSLEQSTPVSEPSVSLYEAPKLEELGRWETVTGSV